jgi:hypothetical protein
LRGKGPAGKKLFGPKYSQKYLTLQNAKIYLFPKSFGKFTILDGGRENTFNLLVESGFSSVLS